ncbi:MAG: M2 family metallopeptidase [Actinomycetes bacterium]
MPADPDTVLRRLTDRLAPLERDLHRALWAATTEARPETSAARQRAQEAWLAALGDPELFAEVQGALAADRTAGAGGQRTRRALEQAGLDLLANQIPEGDRAKLVALQAKVEHAFATVRGRVGDRQLANNELERMLADSGDPAERRAAWEAGKQVGAVVADDVLALVELRNRVARERGHRDWFAFALATGDIDEAWLERMLDQVELATREPFLAVKAELDARLAARFGVAVDDLHPWHYGDLFFQRYDGDAEADLGPLLEGSDTVALTVAAYDGMGLETRHLLERSDLYPRPGKDQHAFCLDVDRAGDIRVLANLAPGEEWLDVLLHEVGHAVYDDHIDRSLPWVLRRPPQGLVTEAVALMLGRLRRDPEFLVGVLGAEEAAARALAGPSRQVLRTGQLVFARWCLVVIRFERAMYADPGGDLAGTWWELVSSLQGLRRPSGRTAPDWASKIHLAVAPVYYQSYLLGELLASQLDRAVRDHAGGFIGRPEAGAFLAERVFAPGATMPWRDLVAAATGSPLGPGTFLAGLDA